MLRIVSTQKSEVSYPLLVDKKYIVGRKQGDVTFPEDQSISRLHAEIVVEHPAGNFNEPLLTPVLVLTDVGSKFGTFATEEGIKNKVAINARETVTLSIGDKVRFGLQWNEFKIDYNPLVVTTSSLKAKTEFKDQIVKLGGHFVNEWNGYVTHVVMESVTLTIKAVCALLAGKPIVTPAYVTDLVSSFETKKSQPDIRNFLPPIAEKGLINISDSSFYPNSSRSTLFAGKTFLFCTPRHLKKLKPAIDAAGGNSSLVADVAGVSLNDNYIIVANPQDIAIGERDPVSKQIIGYYRRSGKRFIGDSEIGLAALYNNIEKHCNPKHSLKESVLPHLTTQTQSLSNASLIVPETQDADLSFGNTSRDVVNETILKANTSNSSTDSSGLSTTKGEKRPVPSSSDVSQPSTSKKRSAAESLSGPNSKRLREVPKPPVLSRTSGSSSRALTSLFNLSDSEDDNDVVVVPESQHRSIADDPEIVPESQPPLVNVVDVRNLQSVENTQESLKEEDAFKVPLSVPEPTVAHNYGGVDNLMTMTDSIMNAKTVPVTNICSESVATSSRSKKVPPAGSSKKADKTTEAGGRKRRRTDSDEDVLDETINKKINLEDEKVRIEAIKDVIISAPLRLMPLINKHMLRRESFIVEGSDLSGCTPRKNFKSFKKVLPKFLTGPGVENSNSRANLNATIESIRCSLKTVKLVPYAYTPGPTVSLRCDTPPPLEAPGGTGREVGVEGPAGIEEFLMDGPPAQHSGSTRANKNRKKSATTEKASPQRRTSPRKRGASPAIQASPSALKFGPLPVEEDDEEDDMWSFKR